MSTDQTPHPTVAPAPGAARRAAALSGVARGSTANLLGALVAMVSVLGLTVAVTRGLSPEHAGVFFATTSLFLLCTAVGQLGTNTGLVYFLSRTRATGGSRAGYRALYRTATRPVLLVGIVMAAGLFVFAEQISSVVNPDHVSRSADHLRVLAVFIPLAALENVTLAGTRGLGTMRPNVVTAQLTRPGLQLLLVVASVLLVEGRGIGLAWGLAYLPAAAMALVFWRRTLRRAEDRPGSGESWPEDQPAPRAAPSAGEFWRFTAPRALASVAQMTMQRLDIVLVAALAGAVEAAIYTAATRFLVVGQTGQRAISLAVQPRLGEALGVDDLVQAKRLYRISTSWLMLITWPTYLVFIFFGERLLELFGRDYAAGRDVLLLLSAVMLFATGCGMVDMVLNMAGRTSWNLYNVLLALTVQIGLDLWLIPSQGILGAAIGWAAGIVLANLVPLLQVGLVHGLHPFGRTTVVTVLLTVSCYGVVPAITLAALGDGWTSLAVSLLVGSCVYVVALWRLRRTLHLVELAQVRRARRR